MRARAWGITGAFLFLVISGCGTALREIKPTQDLVVPVQTPILVVPDQMETVTFGRTIVDIPVGVTVELTRQGLRKKPPDPLQGPSLPVTR